MPFNYLGLSADEFTSIHDSVMEAMAYVVLPVTLLVKDGTQSTDPLFSEAAGGDENFVTYASISASIRLMPSAEVLTDMGLIANADLLAVIPRGQALTWESNNPGKTFEVTSKMKVIYDGVTYNISDVRTDKLPVGDGSSMDYIASIFTATIKPTR